MIDEVSHQQEQHSFAGITREQSKDTGLAMVLICLIAWHFFPEWAGYFKAALIIVVVIDMLVPIIFKPVAWVWFGISHVMGLIMSKLLLSIVFFLIVTPIGFFRRIIGKDGMLLRQWKRNSSSVFLVRDHLFRSGDIEHPY